MDIVMVVYAAVKRAMPIRDLVEAELSEREQKVLALTYGIGEWNTLRDIGIELGISRERARQIQVRGLKRVAKLIQRELNAVSTAEEEEAKKKKKERKNGLRAHTQ